MDNADKVELIEFWASLDPKELQEAANGAVIEEFRDHEATGKVDFSERRFWNALENARDEYEDDAEHIRMLTESHSASGGFLADTRGRYKKFTL